MRREYPDRPIVGVGAVITREDRVVLVRRGNDPLKGAWTIPGGAVEIGETLRLCAQREAYEETGLIVEAGEVLDVTDSIHPGSDGRALYHYVLIDFLCRWTGGELRAGGDAEAACWAAASDLERFRLSEVSTLIIRKALQQT